MTSPIEHKKKRKYAAKAWLPWDSEKAYDLLIPHLLFTSNICPINTNPSFLANPKIEFFPYNFPSKKASPLQDLRVSHNAWSEHTSIANCEEGIKEFNCKEAFLWHLPRHDILNPPSNHLTLQPSKKSFHLFYFPIIIMSCEN